MYVNNKRKSLASDKSKTGNFVYFCTSMKFRNMKKIFLIALGWLFVSGLQAQGNCSCRLDGNKLTMSTGAIERVFEWNGGNLRTVSVKNLKTGRVIPFVGNTPDMLLQAETVPAQDGKCDVKQVASDGIRPAHVEAVVTWHNKQLMIKQVFTLYDEAPAILCDLYLKRYVGEGTGLSEQPVVQDIHLNGKHWKMTAAEFVDATDDYNNLVRETSFIPYRKETYKGNVLMIQNAADQSGLFLLKEAPNTNAQVEYNGDFICETGHIQMLGLGFTRYDVNTEEWTRAYGVVLGIWEGEQVNGLIALRKYLKNERTLEARDEMILANTWGDRSQDTRMNEKFCLNEVEKFAKMGIQVYQIDDGWEQGRTPTRAQNQGNFKDIWKKPKYWEMDWEKFPNGFTPIVARAKELGMRIGMWFNPSVQNNLEDWEKDAHVLISTNKKYGIEVFKIDGLELPTYTAMQNLRNLFDRVIDSCGTNIVFNLDATAGRRAGHFMLSRYGNTFIENRYSDWGNYYPYQTLRNLWQLSKYVPAERIQMEFLNKWRNADRYDKNDPYAPQNYSFDYVFAIVMAAQPLAYFEMGNLPPEANSTGNLINKYRTIQHAFHEGVILPVGDEPTGTSWTGFQSIGKDCKEGYLIFYRENNNQSKALVRTYLPSGKKVDLEWVLGNDIVKHKTCTVAENGSINVELNKKNNFVMFRYQVK